MKTRKINFSELENNMKREEKMNILGGAANTLDQLGPSDDMDFDYSSGGFGMTGFGQGPFVSGSANNFSQLGSYGNSSYNNSSYTGSSYGGGSYGGGGSGGNYNNGWSFDSNGITTTDPYAIDRYLYFAYKNNGMLSGNQTLAFIFNETTLAGQQQNDILLYGNVLNNVNVQNNYKAPSSLLTGINCQNGVLSLGILMDSGGSMLSNTYTGNDINTNYNSFNGDFIFSDNGSFIRTQDVSGGHNIKLSIGGKLYNLSDLDTGVIANNSTLIANIATFFATKAGIPIGFVGTAYSDEPSSSVLAFTKPDGTVYLNMNGGISKLLNNYDNLINVLKHEEFHQIEFAKNKKTNFETHVNVYLNQIRDSSFNNTTSEFKFGQVVSLSNYLMNMDRNDPNNEYGRNTIINKIKEFNNLNNGYQIGSTEVLSLNTKELNLFITKGNIKYEPTVYTPLKN